MRATLYHLLRFAALIDAARSDRSLFDDVAHVGYYHLLEKASEEAAEAWWRKLVEATEGAG